MKKLVVLLLFSVLVGLSACGKEDTGMTTPVPTEAVTVDGTQTGTPAETGEAENMETGEADAGENPNETAEAYEELLSVYSQALAERWNAGELMENELGDILADCYGDDPFGNIGYTVSDLDGNGDPELVIAATANITDEFYGKLIFGLYMLDENGNAVKVFGSSVRDRYYYAGENLFAHQGSSGAADSFDTTEKLENGAMTDLGYVTAPAAYQQIMLSEITENQNAAAGSNNTLCLPILDEIDRNVTLGTAGAYLKAVQSAVALLDWGTATGLDPEEIREAAVAWLAAKGNDEQAEFAEKMRSVDDAYQKLLGDNAEELLISAGCADAAYPWSDAPVESIEAIMEAVGLR